MERSRKPNRSNMKKLSPTAKSLIKLGIMIAVFALLLATIDIWFIALAPLLYLVLYATDSMVLFYLSLMIALLLLFSLAAVGFLDDWRLWLWSLPVQAAVYLPILWWDDAPIQAIAMLAGMIFAAQGLGLAVRARKRRRAQTNPPAEPAPAEAQYGN